MSFTFTGIEILYGAANPDKRDIKQKRYTPLGMYLFVFPPIQALFARIAIYISGVLFFPPFVCRVSIYSRNRCFCSKAAVLMLL
jgi:hypothetical protein